MKILKTGVIDICSSNTRAFIIFKKVNGIVKSNTFAHY